MSETERGGNHKRSERELLSQRNNLQASCYKLYVKGGVYKPVKNNCIGFSSFMPFCRLKLEEKTTKTIKLYFSESTNISVDIGDFTRWFSGIVWNLRIIGATTGWVEIDVWLISPVSEVVDSTTLQLQGEREREGEV